MDSSHRVPSRQTGSVRAFDLNFYIFFSQQNTIDATVHPMQHRIAKNNCFGEMYIAAVRGATDKAYITLNLSFLDVTPHPPPRVLMCSIAASHHSIICSLYMHKNQFCLHTVLHRHLLLLYIIIIIIIIIVIKVHCRTVVQNSTK